jgi:dihydrofolate reductase
MRHFRTVTTNAPKGKQNAVIMGRKTWESLGCKSLPNRYNIVVSQTLSPQSHNDITIVSSLDEALQHCENVSIHCAYVIGGARLYAEALEHPQCNKVYITHILHHYDCDVFFPVDILMKYFSLVREGSIQTTMNQHSFTFCEYNRLKNTKI